jgi:hypothetical protein
VVAGTCASAGASDCESLPAPVASPTEMQDPAAWPNAVQLGAALAPGVSPLTPGPNPLVHPTWVPAGERYEFLIDFSRFAGQSVYVNNNAAAPFPDGVAPQDPQSPFSELATLMRFDVQAAATAATGPAVPTCGAAKLSWDSALTPAKNGVGCVAVQGVLDRDFVDLKATVVAAAPCPGQAGACVAAERVLFLSEKVDGDTGSSQGLQISGHPGLPRLPHPVGLGLPGRSRGGRLEGRHARLSRRGPELRREVGRRMGAGGGRAQRAGRRSRHEPGLHHLSGGRPLAAERREVDLLGRHVRAVRVALPHQLA